MTAVFADVDDVDLAAAAIEIAREKAEAEKGREASLTDWACTMRLDGKPFSFDEHEYLRTIYADTAPHIVLIKATQLGGSVWALFRAIHACKTGLNVMYFFPTHTDVMDFSKSRLTPILQENAALSRTMQDTDTAGLKRIGSKFLYMRGMKSKIGMKSVPADMLVFDELDEAEPNAKKMAMERVAHSDYKRVIELSNPSLPDYGIDESFQKSDQRHWTMKCSACGAWTCLDKEFPKKMGQDVRVLLPREDGTVYRACVKCSAELDTEQGEWVADFPGRATHGYLMSQLFSSKVDPKAFLEEYRTTRYPDRFFNLKLGIAWADVSRRVDRETVLACCTDRVMAEKAEWNRYHVMGVDTGKDLHVTILAEDHTIGGWRLLHLAICETFGQLDDLMLRFNIGKCVIDGLPETHATREFADRHHQALLCYFSETQKTEPKVDEERRIITINRTDALDASRAVIRNKQLSLPRQDALVEEFADHVSHDAKVLEEDEETGAKRFRYIKTGTNHFSFALTYAILAGATGHRISSVESIPKLRTYASRVDIG